MAFVQFLDEGLSVFGSVYLGPTVVVESANQSHAAGDRVVPVSLNYTVTREGKFVVGGDGLYYRPASSTEPFLLTPRTAELFCELTIRPREDFTWEQLDHEDDLIVSVTGTVLSSEE